MAIPQILALCATLAALWCVVFWSREWVFRLVLVISACVHSLLFIPLGWINTPTGRMPAGPLLVHYTFVQGMPSEDPAVNDEGTRISDIGDKENVIPGDEQEQEAPTDREPDPVIERKPPDSSVKLDPDLPEIADVEIFTFDEHPSGESYRKELQRLIEMDLDIPEEILREGYEGKQLVYFKLLRDGSLVRDSVFIHHRYVSSDHLVNTTSIENIRRISAGFPALPAGVKEDEVWFHVEIDYTK